jgi:hypothetical protein
VSYSILTCLGLITSSLFLCVLPHIRDISRKDCNTAVAVVISLIQSRLDYCNSLLTFLPLNLVVFNLFSVLPCTRAINRTPKIFHISPIYKFLTFLKINARIQFHILSPIRSSLNYNQPVIQPVSIVLVPLPILLCSYSFISFSLEWPFFLLLYSYPWNYLP